MSSQHDAEKTTGTGALMMLGSAIVARLAESSAWPAATPPLVLFWATVLIFWLMGVWFVFVGFTVLREASR